MLKAWSSLRPPSHYRNMVGLHPLAPAPGGKEGLTQSPTFCRGTSWGDALVVFWG